MVLLAVVPTTAGARGPKPPTPRKPPPTVQPPPPTQGSTLTDWTTWGFDVARWGYNPKERLLDHLSAGWLESDWTFDTGGAIDTQPTVATQVNVTINGRRTTANLVFVGNEHGDFFAVDAANGAVVWRRRGRRSLGSRVTGCSDLPGNRFGVTSTPVLDRASNTVYVAGGDGHVYALDMSTGATKRGWPVAITGDPVHEHVWGALTLVRGAVYVPVASDCDILPYHGRLVEIVAATHTVVGAWYVVPGYLSGGGIWSWGGVSVDRRAGRIFTATGNVFAATEHQYYAEHVVELNMNLAPLASNFVTQIKPDDDYGSTPMPYQAPGCGPQLAVMQKHGVLSVYNRYSISSGPVQTLQLDGSHEFTGGPAYDPATRLLYVAHAHDSPDGRYKQGLVALRVGKRCRLSLAWQRSSPHGGVTSTATVANGVVYYGNGGGDTVFAYDASTGKPVWNSGGLITGPVFAAPTVVNGALYVGSWDHKLHAFSAPAVITAF